MPEGVEVPQEDLGIASVNSSDLLDGSDKAAQQNENITSTENGLVKESQLTQTRREFVQKIAIAVASMMTRRGVASRIARKGAGVGVSGLNQRGMEVASEVGEKVINTARDKGEDFVKTVANIDKTP